MSDHDFCNDEEMERRLSRAGGLYAETDARLRAENERLSRELTNAQTDAMNAGMRIDRAEKRATQAEAQLAVAVGALEYFQKNGCPVCSGDCGSANPPVLHCPMQAIAALPDRAADLLAVVEAANNVRDRIPTVTGYIGTAEIYALHSMYVALAKIDGTK